MSDLFGGIPPGAFQLFKRNKFIEIAAGQIENVLHVYKNGTCIDLSQDDLTPEEAEERDLKIAEAWKVANDIIRLLFPALRRVVAQEIEEEHDRQKQAMDAETIRHGYYHSEQQGLLYGLDIAEQVAAGTYRPREANPR